MSANTCCDAESSNALLFTTCTWLTGNYCGSTVCSLMFIAFVPFPTGLLEHHMGQPIATAFYGLVWMLTGLTFCHHAMVCIASLRADEA